MKERLSYWFMSPFGKNIGIFFSFLILSSIVDLYGYFINESIAKAVFILMHHCIIVYFLVLLCQNVNRFISKIVFILKRLYSGEDVELDEMYSAQESRSDKVAVFLAVLELSKSGRIIISDDNKTAKFSRERRKGGA